MILICCLCAAKICFTLSQLHLINSFMSQKWQWITAISFCYCLVHKQVFHCCRFRKKEKGTILHLLVSRFRFMRFSRSLHSTHTIQRSLVVWKVGRPAASSCWLENPVVLTQEPNTKSTPWLHFPQTCCFTSDAGSQNIITDSWNKCRAFTPTFCLYFYEE